MLNEHAAILADVNEDLLGFGDPSPTTKTLLAEGLIDIDVVDQGGKQYWKARLTKAGKRALKTHQEGHESVA